MIKRVKGSNFTDSDRDSIFKLTTTGMQNVEISRLLNCSESSVSYIANVGRLAEKGEWAKVDEICKISVPLGEWAAKRWNRPNTEQPKKTETEIANEQNVCELIATLVKEIRVTNELLKKLL